MSTEQTGNQTTNHQAPAIPAVSQTGVGQGMMTSWLRRRFGLDAESRERPGARRGRPVGVVTERVQGLLARVRSTRERARVWEPDIGSLRPELLQRFSAAIARRHERLPLVGVRRRLARPVDDWQDTLELTLPRGASPAEAGTSATPGKLKGPSIFSVGQQIPRMGPQMPTASRPSSSSRVPPRPAGQAQHRQPPPRSRLFARVEEVAPAGRKPSAEEESPVQQEADLEPQELDLDVQEPAGEPPVQDVEPGPEGQRPSPPRAQPTIQRRAVEARPPAPSRRRPSPPGGPRPAVEEIQASPPAEEVEEPQAPPSETTEAPGEPEPEAVEGQASDEMPLRPPPVAPSQTPPQERVMREPSLPRREQETKGLPDAAPPSGADTKPGLDKTAARPPHQQPPTRGEREKTPSEPARAPTSLAEPVQLARPTGREEKPSEMPRRAESEAEPHLPADRERAQAPQVRPADSAPVADRVQRQALPEEQVEAPPPAKPEDKVVESAHEGAGGEAGEEMVLRRPPAPPETVDRQLEKPEPLMEVARQRGTPGKQRQVPSDAASQAGPALSADGRRILARARSRAQLTLSKLPPARHRPPEPGPLPAGARVPDQATAPGPGILGQIQRRRRHRPASLTLYGRGPEVRIGPDSSMPVTQRIASARRRGESGPGQPSERQVPPIPPEVRRLLSAMGGRAEEGVPGGGLPLQSLPRPSAPGGTPSQRATGGTPARQGPPGGSSEPPWLPPPPPQEPSLPLARPAAPRPTGEQAVERVSRTRDVVQRAPDVPVGTLQREPAVVQRVLEEDDLYEDLDLSALARRVYPVIKRMLSIERERTRGRSL